MSTFINTNCKRILKSSQSTRAKDLMIFVDSVIDYDTTNDVFYPMSTNVVFLDQTQWHGRRSYPTQGLVAFLLTD